MTKKLSRKDRSELYGHASKFFIDIAKLVFAGIILADILKQDVEFWWMLAGGGLVVIVFLLISYNLFIMSKR
ncbi:MAG: hypothetical protein IJ628_02220 [Bacteroidaceae bacterium]|nr:hypothetical protein [Bacteroidaceae bacterium]